MSGLERATAPKERARHVPSYPAGTLNVLTCGSVDDGKSTLIGRLLWDASNLPDDQREMVHRSARASGTPGKLDFSLLLDGLIAEREQGITIDIAWRYMDTGSRRLVLLDSPGHDQYTRNMASGASHADVAIMLIDARHGLKRQTLRHAAILQLMGVSRVILAVNKMDLVAWNEAGFRAIERDFMAMTERLRFHEACAIPLSARHGDNVLDRSVNMPWYDGATLVSALEAVPSRKSVDGKAFRMPVQTVLRDGDDFRGLAGTISSGRIRVGEPVCEVVSGLSARVTRIATMNGDRESASVGEAVALVLDIDLDIARGAVLAAPGSPPVKARTLDTRLVWLADRPFDANHGYLLRTAADVVPVSRIEITAHVDLDTLSLVPATACVANDIAAASIELGRGTALDAFGEHEGTGAFLLVDPLDGATLAGGIVVGAFAQNAGQENADAGFVVTRAMLKRGVCLDLGSSEADAFEFRRRARAVLGLLAEAGVAASLDAELTGC